MIYTTKQIASMIGVSYDYFKRNRSKFEDYLKWFYDFRIVTDNKSINYELLEERAELIPYKVFKKQSKNKAIFQSVVEVLKQDNRQTGSNIARIISQENEIIPLQLQLSTLTIYSRKNLKRLVQEHYYEKTNYTWCVLNKRKNAYEPLTESQITELRSYFHCNDENIEIIWAEYQEGGLTLEEAKVKAGDLTLKGIVLGLQRYSVIHNTGRPIYVPVYERCAWVTDEMVNEIMNQVPEGE